MKLRNKKTGEIQRYDICLDRGSSEGFGRVEYCYDTIEELNDEWEDYIPLIKDKKIRNAVRDWADLNGIHRAKYGEEGESSWFYYEELDKHNKSRLTAMLKFRNTLVLNRSELWRSHTITELCGEEQQ